MISTYNDYPYIIDIHVPDEAPPVEGFPVVFVLDGTRYSTLMNEVLKGQLKNRQKTNVKPMIIIGIGHKEHDIPAQRFYDFTAPAKKYSFPVRRGRTMKPMPAGGAEKLMQFITAQLTPAICAKYKVDEKNSVLYGHSLGGLFVLWSYLKYPNHFAKYVALSPSIWWNEHELLEQLKVANENYEAPLYITVGGAEGDMVDDAEKFANMAEQKGIVNEFYIVEEENHASVIPTTMSRVLRFLNK